MVGSDVFLCYKKSAVRGNSLAYQAGKFYHGKSQLHNALLGLIYFCINNKSEIRGNSLAYLVSFIMENLNEIVHRGVWCISVLSQRSEGTLLHIMLVNRVSHISWLQTGAINSKKPRLDTHCEGRMFTDLFAFFKQNSFGDYILEI